MQNVATNCSQSFVATFCIRPPTNFVFEINNSKIKMLPVGGVCLDMSMKKIPLVSVCMITYNHANYIAQAIEGVIKQKTCFPIQIVIADDCSTDETRDIIERYAQKNSSITFLTREKNIGMMPNLIDAMSICTGDYLAFCEGDDFWTDPQKLQKQVDFLEGHPDYAICAHNLTIVRADGKSLNEFVRPENTEMQYDMHDLADKNMLATASCIYRNNFTSGHCPTGFPEWILKVKIGDYCLHMLAARHGKIKYFPEAMGSYRLHGGGVWTGESDFNRQVMFFHTISYLRIEFSGNIIQLLMHQQLKCLHELMLIDKIRFNQFLLEYRNQIIDLFVEEYPFAINELMDVNKIVKSEQSSNIGRILNKFQKIYRFAVGK